MFTLHYCFGGMTTPGCMDAADTDDNGEIEITDPIRTLNYLFLNGPPPSSPNAECGPDLSDDGLDCRSYSPCGAP